jgi:hypothetical protein
MKIYFKVLQIYSQLKQRNLLHIPFFYSFESRKIKIKQQGASIRINLIFGIFSFPFLFILSEILYL